VKIFLGHNGKPCPWSSSALASFNGYIQGQQNETGGILIQVVEQFGLPQTEVLQKISDALDHTNGSMPQLERNILRASAECVGITELDFLHHLRSALSQDADDDAATLQADSDKATVDVEVGEEMVDGVEGLAVPLKEDFDEDNENWEDEDSQPPRGDTPRFLPRPPPVDGVYKGGSYQQLPFLTCGLVCLPRTFA